MEVEVISVGGSPSKFEEQINKFLADLVIKGYQLESIEFSTCGAGNNEIFYSAIIIYETHTIK